MAAVVVEMLQQTGWRVVAGVVVDYPSTMQVEVDHVVHRIHHTDHVVVQYYPEDVAVA